MYIGYSGKLWPLSYIENDVQPQPTATGDLDSCFPCGDIHLRRSSKLLSSCATKLHALEAEKEEDCTVIINTMRENIALSCHGSAQFATLECCRD